MHPYDHWQKCQTRCGLAADLVISALQKEIRRGHEENAATLAYEMLVTSGDMEEYLWFRLKVISVEDVGFGDILAPVVINSLDSMRKTIKQEGDRGLFAIHAVRFLCSRTKDRSSDEMYNWIMKEYKAGNLVPEIPEYAIDKHTLLGQQQGRDEQWFYDEGSKVSPELQSRNTTYRERILKILEDQRKEANQ
jgi:replication-associated recombination protein RarA